MLGFGKESWKDFLSRLVEALQSDSLFVGLNDNEQMKFTAWCYCNGKQISYTYTLLPGETDEIKSKVADMVFDLLAFARRKRKSELGTFPGRPLFCCRRSSDELPNRGPRVAVASGETQGTRACS